MNAAEIRCDRVRDVYRRPRFGVIARCDERRRHDTDDGIHITAERNRFTDNLLVAVELFHPQVVAQHDYKRSAVFIVFMGDETSALRSYTKRFKETASHLSDLKLDRFTSARIGQRLHHQAAESAERFALRFDISKIGRRLVRSETDQPGRIVVWQWSQQDGVDDTEDRGVSADAERERDHRNHSERRPLQQAANSKSDVFDYRIHFVPLWLLFFVPFVALFSPQRHERVDLCGVIKLRVISVVYV